jgi:hypothetical protein
LPTEKEGAENGWQTSFVSEETKIKFGSIIDKLVKVHQSPREWLKMNNEDEYVEQTCQLVPNDNGEEGVDERRFGRG